MDFPEIVLLVITYDRYLIMKRTLDALQDLFNYPNDKLHVVVSDDSTGRNYLPNLRKLKRYKTWGAEGLQTIETPHRSGWGRHVNYALARVMGQYPKARYVFQIEDDYVLQCQLDARVGVAVLEDKPNLAMLRYRGTGGGRYLYHQFEANIRAYLPDYDESSGIVQGVVSYLQIDHASKNLYIYSHGAHLKRVGENGFHEHYGLYPEGLPLGATEEGYAHIVRDSMKIPDALGIAIMPSWVTMKFQHIGKSFKGTDEDIHDF